MSNFWTEVWVESQTVFVPKLLKLHSIENKVFFIKKTEFIYINLDSEPISTETVTANI